MADTDATLNMLSESLQIAVCVAMKLHVYILQLHSVV